jgi:hypothetical protein
MSQLQIESRQYPIRKAKVKAALPAYIQLTLLPSPASKKRDRSGRSAEWIQLGVDTSTENVVISLSARFCEKFGPRTYFSRSEHLETHHAS